MSSTCPSCGDDLETERKMKIHHAKVHNESLVEYTTNVCPHCGDEYPVDKRRQEERKYCSQTCSFRSNYEEQEFGTMDDIGQRYGEGWKSNKQAATTWFEGVCVDCFYRNRGMVEVDRNHHLIPAPAFADPECRNDVKNIVPLCYKCHANWEETAIEEQIERFESILKDQAEYRSDYLSSELRRVRSSD